MGPNYRYVADHFKEPAKIANPNNETILSRTYKKRDVSIDARCDLDFLFHFSSISPIE